MRRKLIKQGSGGLTVCLPKKWTDKNSLQPGDEIELIPEGKELVMRTSKRSQKKLEIDLDKPDKYQIRWVISYAHNVGFNQIKINFKELPKTTLLNNIISSFTGLEITEKTENSVTIQSFFYEEEEQIEKLIIKMFQFNNQIIEEIDKNWDKADVNFIDMYDYLLKLRDNCLKMIQAFQYQKEKSYYYHYFVIELEKVAKSFNYLGRAIIASKLPRSKLFQQLKDYFNETYNCYLKKDFDKTNRLWLKIRKYIRTEIGFSEMKKLKENPVFLAYYYDTLLKLSEFSNSLLLIQVPIKKK